MPEQNGQVILEDMFSNKQIIANVDSIKEEYAQWVESREREIRDAFVESRSDFLRLTTDKPFIKPITDLFTGRTKKVV